MTLTEQHVIKQTHSLYRECDNLCWSTKNIYNLSLYKVRQGFFENSYEPLNNLYHLMKGEDCFKALPSRVATATVLQVQQTFKNFFAASRSYRETPGKFLGKPKMPRYKDVQSGRTRVSYSYQALSKLVFKKEGLLKLSGTQMKIKTQIKEFSRICSVDIIPRLDYYVIEVKYEAPDNALLGDNKRYASIDLGLNNLATVTSNIKSDVPFIINGKPLKSINQFYNNRLAHYKSKLELVNGNQKSSKKTKRLTAKRGFKVKDYLHKASAVIVAELQKKDITKLVIGKNDNWKQEIKIGSKNNQNFVSIPHAQFIQLLEYKCAKVGIRTMVQEESYTSKCSFLDGERPEKREVYQGQRIKRGLFRSGSGRLINADVNGSLNIMIKAIPKAFHVEGIEGVVVHPRIIKIRK